MKLFSPFPSVQLAYSYRADGSFRTPQSITDFLALPDHHPLAYLRLEHSNKIVPVIKLSNETQEGDALSTALKNQILSFVVGDCFPVLLFDPKHHAMTLLHCGWKSLVQNLIALSLEQMHNTYQTQIEDVQVWIGPGICATHYTQVEKPAQFGLPHWQPCTTINEYKIYSINLQQFIQEELVRLGVVAANVLDENLCTYEQNDVLFSHRRAMIEDDEDGRFFVAAWQK